jgi:hypothetical protein
MARFNSAACLLIAAFEAGQSAAGWRLPATIEALTDVPARLNDTQKQQRGVLYVASPKPFRPVTIRKGQRFQMITILREGECRIRFEKNEYLVSSCPWLEGFTDRQTDVFEVVSGRNPL